jgi:hypothetical protein
MCVGVPVIVGGGVGAGSGDVWSMYCAHFHAVSRQWGPLCAPPPSRIVTAASQDSNTAQMVFKTEAIVAWISKCVPCCVVLLAWSCFPYRVGLALFPLNWEGRGLLRSCGGSARSPSQWGPAEQLLLGCDTWHSSPSSRLVHTHIHTYTHIHTHTHTYTHAHIHTRTHTHTHIHTHTCIHIHTYTHVHTHTHIHTRAHALAHTHAHTRTHTRAHAWQVCDPAAW